MKKQMGFKTKGMNRDLSVSAFNPEFSFENINLRLITNEGNTTMSWVNEKGTLKVDRIRINRTPWEETQSEEMEVFPGIPIGTAVINDTLVVFTHDEEGGYDYIFCIDNIKDGEENTISGYQIYKGNLNFKLDHPIETLVSYEADYIQKVYWTDGYNQPRVINIKANKDKIKVWNHGGDYSTQSVADTFFDFVPALKLTDTVSINQKTGAGGMFAPGVIQYAITYINKYGQQSNVVYASPLYYLAHADRGASPEEKVGTHFEITVSNADLNFDYVRIYSIQRTSIDATPIVKLLDDIPIISEDNEAKDIILTDNGTTGASIDPTELLFVGGKEIVAYTMADKDNTLFMGNIVQKNGSVNAIQDKVDALREDNELNIVFTEDHFFGEDSPVKRYDKEAPHGTYDYDCQLGRSQEEITTFKGGEWYRFGFQLQKITGEWTEPIFLNDVQNPLYPKTAVHPITVGSETHYRVGLPYAKMEGFDLRVIDEVVPDFYKTYKKIRPVTVFPTIGDRSVICQGVLNPTVFNAIDRIDNAPFAQASWYYRPYTIESLENDSGGSEIIIEYPEVTNTPQESQEDVRTDPNFSEYNDVYGILLRLNVVDFPTSWENIIKNIGLNGYLPSYGYSSDSHRELPFIGIVNTGRKVGSLQVKAEFLLITERSYTEDELDDFDINLYEDGYPTMLRKTTGEPMPLKLYANIDKDDYSMLYYSGDNTAPESYTFRFSGREGTVGQPTYTNFEAIFPRNNKEVKDAETVVKGNITPFTHYDSLVTQDSVDTTKNTWMNTAKQVEIQGSVKTYESPFASERIKDKNSNTQFFIDQSIVTLNSPDIEFDTEVQTCSGEGFKLRIVGAIPITASSSAHSFDISSAMLETNYNSYLISKDIVFGTGEKEANTRYTNEHTAGNTNNIPNAPHGGRKLISGYLWNDTFVVYKAHTSEDDPQTPETAAYTLPHTYDYLIHPWHRKGSLNNDYRSEDYASSLLRTKKESNLLYSSETEYFYCGEGYGETSYKYDDISVQIHLTENEQVQNMRLPRQIDTSSEINYYPNIDKVLYNQEGYKPLLHGTLGQVKEVFTPIQMKYKSMSHAVVALNKDSGSVSIPLLPYYKVSNNNNVGKYIKPSGEGTKTFWGDEMSFTQPSVEISAHTLFPLHRFGNNISPEKPAVDESTTYPYSFLWLGELYREDKDVSNRFGGTSLNAIRSNRWVAGGKEISISEDSPVVDLTWTVGDTYYQRYDSLKTYAFTEEDSNQLVEILSFMCETRVNIDGRYDKNRGQSRSYVMSPRNFNILNPVYSQKNNFFQSTKSNIDDLDKLEYPNLITFSRTKEAGADVDLYTNVTLASNLGLGGDKGKITAIRKLNDTLIAFQDSGVSQIMFNDNTALSTTEGAPIEIANSGKVTGAKYFSDKIGCSNKWSIASSPSGLYFMDSNEKSIYMFNGQLNNLSLQFGFNSWCKSHIVTEDAWNPTMENSAFVSHYDRQNQEVLFTDKDTALAYSEKTGTFTSFYSYEDSPFLCNVLDKGIWLKADGSIWKHRLGEYGKFFGINKPYSITLVGNPEPQADKIFTNIEFRASVEGDGELDQETGKFIFSLPFDSLETWNDYQHGIAKLNLRNSYTHHTLDNNASLKRKFRIWRCDVPRDNAELDTDAELGVFRFKKHPMDRMRNPWLYLKLWKDTYTDKKAEIHDVVMTYHI